MTEESRKARDEHLMSALAVALTAGHTITQIVHGQAFRIEPNSSGSFHVTAGDFIETFPDVRSAVAYYLDLAEPA